MEKTLKTLDSHNEIMRTWVTGLLAASGVYVGLAIIFSVIGLPFFHWVTQPILLLIAVFFFCSGFKTIGPRMMGYQVRLGKRDFSTQYTEGTYWFWPFTKIEQTNRVSEAEKGKFIYLEMFTHDSIPLEVTIKYNWKINGLEDLERIDLKSSIMDLEHIALTGLSNKTLAQIIADPDATTKIIVDLFENEAKSSGLSISKVVPLITPPRKFHEFLYEIEKRAIKSTAELLYLLNVVKISKEEAINYLIMMKKDVQYINKNYNFNSETIEKIFNLLNP